MNLGADGHWLAVKDGDPRARALFKRHYSALLAARSASRGRIEPRLFVGPGEKMVLLTVGADALWAWRREKFRRDGQRGIGCSIFRNESAVRSSTLIMEAMELAWTRWSQERLYTFVDPVAVASPNPGYCFKVVGWRYCGTTQTGLHILEYETG